MAMIDYGAIGFKNGKLISTEFFTPMKDTVGWEDTENDVYYTFDEKAVAPVKINGNYFLCIGDINYTICFYKNSITIFSRDFDEEHDYWREYENFSALDFKCNWTKWQEYIGVNKATITKRNGYYVFKWKYKGDKYKVYFGYGVDLDFYKKTKRVNYYRSPEYLFKNLKRKVFRGN